jgi:hypothetical protein
MPPVALGLVWAEAVVGIAVSFDAGKNNCQANAFAADLDFCSYQIGGQVPA